jgi:general secretion pathway protein E
VLSTLHTNNAAAGATRLLDMGIEDYLLTSTVHGILAQRLIRTLCTDCRQRDGSVSLLHDSPPAGEPPLTAAYRAGGRPRCRGAGYRGRTSVGEFLPMTDSIRRLVMERADASRIEKQAVEEGMLTLYQEGVSKVRSGVTTAEEILRVTQDY